MTCLSLSNLLAIIQLIITTGVGVATIIVYYRITSLTNSNNAELNAINDKNNLFNKINSDLDRIVDFTIKYPYFDNPDYKEIYLSDLQSNDTKKKQKAIRYNAFAIMNYNFVEDLYRFYNGDENKMESYCDFKELITDHKNYWENLSANEKDGYHKIKALIEKVILEFKKK